MDKHKLEPLKTYGTEKKKYICFLSFYKRNILIQYTEVMIF